MASTGEGVPRSVMFCFKQKTAYEITRWLEFRRVLFRSRATHVEPFYRTPIKGLYMCGAATHPGGGVMGACGRSEERRVGKSVDLGGRRIIKKKKKNKHRERPPRRRRTHRDEHSDDYIDA